MLARLAVVACLLVSSAGCDESVALFGRRDVGDGERSLGVVVLSRSEAVDLSGSSERFGIDARFVRYRTAFESETRAVLGLSDVDVLPEVDTCSDVARGRTEPAGGAASGLASGGPGAELLDVGRIRVRTGTRERFLAVRTFPDLLDVLSGVTYGGGTDLGYRAGRSYEVLGDRDRTPWVTVTAPPDWSDLRVNGLAISGGLAGALEPGRPLELRWVPWTERSSEVVFSLSWTGANGTVEGITCHPADDGAFDLPAGASARMPAVPEIADLAIRAERFSRVSFEMDRVDDAEAIFRVSITAPLR